ncbi:MAG: hypothetical protein ABI566_12390 [Pseudolysinimonas sp.]
MRLPTTPATTLAGAELARGRLVGAAAIAFAVLVLTENVLFTVTGSPGYDSPIEDVLAYYAANHTVVAIVAGMVALYLPLLLLFVTGLHGLVERRGGAGADWSRLAIAAGVAVSAIFVVVNVLLIGFALSANTFVESTSAYEIVWRIHASAFALVLPALGAMCVGASLAAHESGLTPAWQRVLGLAAGGLLLVAGVGNVAIADGSPLIFAGLLGFVALLVWLFVIGVRLVRGSR